MPERPLVPLGPSLASDQPRPLITAAEEEAAKSYSPHVRESLRAHAEADAAHRAASGLPPVVDISADKLRAAILARGLPEAVARIAIEGGEAVHPALAFTIVSIDLDAHSPVVWLLEAYGDDTWVPVWQHGSSTNILFSMSDGSFAEWDAECPDSREDWPDWSSVVDSLITELWEAEVSDDDLDAVRALLLPTSL